MHIYPTDIPRLKGFRYPREIIACAVWAYLRLILITADAKDLSGARNVIVSRKTVRFCDNRFGQYISYCIRRDQPRPASIAVRERMDLDMAAVKARRCFQRIETLMVTPAPRVIATGPQLGRDDLNQPDVLPRSFRGRDAKREGERRSTRRKRFRTSSITRL